MATTYVVKVTVYLDEYVDGMYSREIFVCDPFDMFEGEDKAEAERVMENLDFITDQA